MSLRRKVYRIVLFLAAFAYLSTFSSGIFAYSPQALYDQVWKLINTKYVDQYNNGQDWNRWRHKYDEVIKTEKDSYVAIDTMLSSLNDPYTRFLQPKEFAEEGESISGTLKGIGVQIGVKDGKLLVIAPLEDTPASKAGLEANDYIVEINSKSTKGMSVKDAADNIKGEEGTFVKLLIKRDDKEKLYSVQRAEITLKAVTTTSSTFKLNNNIGYIRLSTFLNKNASQEISNALSKLKDKEGFILDLRSNPGGLLTNALYISDMFLGKDKTIVSTVDRDGYKETQRTDGRNITNKPLVVLINGGSASASEILSGALKDNARAVLVGEKSFGKGLVQEINKLPDGSGVNITTQKYLTPSGTDINKKGIEPNVIVKNTEEDIKNKKDVQLQKAQEVLEALVTQKQDSLTSSSN
ncbi:MAG: S41 family peptidase [Candidatus Gastranaerophilaceae bacterium]